MTWKTNKKSVQSVQSVSNISVSNYSLARRIEIRTRRLVQAALAGGYRSAFRGSGLDFDEVRPYAPGDDIRSINWQVTARMGQPYIKRYVEERQLTLLLLVDVSGSTAFGSGREKREVMLEVTAVLAAAAHFNQDRVGMMLFTDQVEALIKPGQGRNHTRRLIHTLLTTQPKGRGTNIDLPLLQAERVLKQRGVIVLISDFMADLGQWQPRLARLNRRHDVIAVAVRDGLEMPDLSEVNLGLLPLQDNETGELCWVDTADMAWREAFVQQAVAEDAVWQQALRQAQVDCLQVATGERVLPVLGRFFRGRGKLLQRNEGRKGQR